MWCCEHACACEILLTESVPALHPALYACRDVRPIFCNYVVHEQDIQRISRLVVWTRRRSSANGTIPVILAVTRDP